MRELDKDFEGRGVMRGIHFKQILSNGYAYIYELRSKGEDGDVAKVWYEVFARKENKGGVAELNGVKVEYEPSVMYPKEKAFGFWAWSSYSLDRAMNIYQTITKYNKDKKWSTELERSSGLGTCG